LWKRNLHRIFNNIVGKNDLLGGVGGGEAFGDETQQKNTEIPSGKVKSARDGKTEAL
jgi:hypothetical protein